MHANTLQEELEEERQARHDAEIAYQRAQDQLDDLRERLASLDDVQRQGRNWSSEKIADLIHEIRTPLTCIQAALLLLSDGTAGVLSERARVLIETAYCNGERVANLVDSMLQLECLEGSSSLNLVNLDLVELARRAIDIHRSFGELLGVKLHFETELEQAWVNADRDGMMQVFANVLSNAIKYSPSDSMIEVLIRQDAATFRVAIKDHGPGIAQDFQDQVFEKFARANSGGRHGRSGSGLGLSIARAIVERHDGAISFETHLGAGTTFYFDLPAVRGLATPGDELDDTGLSHGANP